MPVFQLIEGLPVFPAPEYAQLNGLLAIGGDLSEARLLEAYRQGIFPWYEEGQPLLWWSPNPRLVLYPEELKISRSLKKTLRKGVFEASLDTAFEEVIQACAEVRVNSGEGTWITGEMQDAYLKLHQSGYAHSFESWHEGELVGGLYGVRIGGCFFGESMFSRRSDSSKCALVALAGYAEASGIRMIDCQMHTGHLVRMGAREISRKAFLSQLRKHIRKPLHSSSPPPLSQPALAY